MKHALILLLLACLYSPMLAADGFTLGGGLNLSSTSDEDEEGATLSNLTGYNLGFGYEKEISPTFVMVYELKLETRGEKARLYDVDLDDYINGRLELLYLQVPVFAMVKVPMGTASLTLFAGPSFGINLSADAEFEYDGETISSDIQDQIQTFDFGIEAGAGIEFPMGSGAFFIRPSYYLGLTEFVDTDDANVDSKHRNIKIKMGYRFPP